MAAGSGRGGRGRAAVSWNGIEKMADEIFTERLLRLAHAVMLALGIYLIGRDYLVGFGTAGQPMGRDFSCFWSAGRMVLDGGVLDVFNPHSLSIFQENYPGGPQGKLSPWFYPPLLLLYIACAFALLPYKLAYVVYLVLSTGIYYGVARRLFPLVKPMYIFGFPAFWYNLLSGQNGLLTAVLLVGGLVYLVRSQITAGILLGLLSFKPQLCLALPVFLLLERRWQAILTGTMTLAALVAMSTVFWGTGVWWAFLDGLKEAQTYNQSGDMMTPDAFAHLYGSLKVIGLSHSVAMALNYTFAAVAGGAAIRIWLLPYDQTVKFAAVILMTLLLPPHLLYYDFVATGAVIIWLWRYELLRPALVLLWIAPFIWPFFGMLGVPLFTIAAGALLFQLSRVSVGVHATGTVHRQ
jgi:alpha-1,2-mannosyltransferase